MGTLLFNDGGSVSFNLVITHGAKTILLIQTNVTSTVTNVFQGTATKIAD